MNNNAILNKLIKSSRKFNPKSKNYLSFAFHPTRDLKNPTRDLKNHLWGSSGVLKDF